MAVQRLDTACLLRPGDVEPSSPELEVVGTFNPGAIEVDGGVVLMVRVAEQPRESQEGQVGLPRWEDGRVVVDWLAEGAVEPLDPRLTRVRENGLLRLTMTSHLLVLRSGDGRSFDSASGDRFLPDSRYETYGVEDARITRLGGRYYITYVAVSRHGACTALASTSDFRTFERHGIIFPPENKDVVLFPRKIGGRYTVLHRPNPHLHFGPPGIWLARSDDLADWGDHAALHTGTSDWEVARIGAGPAPIETERGWLEMYHGKARAHGEQGVGTYSAACLLLDREEPGHVIARSQEPVLAPEKDFERRGFVDNVVFPTGVVERGDRLLVYYGASDAYTGLVTFAREDLLASIR